MRNAFIALTILACLTAAVVMLWDPVVPGAPKDSVARAPAEAGEARRAGPVATRPDPDPGSRPRPYPRPRPAPRPGPGPGPRPGRPGPKTQDALSLPAPRHDQAVTLFSRAQILKWDVGSVGGKGYRVSPVINFGRGRELNHHRVTVDYTGRGSVQVYLASHTGGQLASVLKGTPVFRTLSSGVESRFTSSLSAAGYAWVLVRTTGQVTVTGIKHVCWRGTGTLQGHESGALTFASAPLPFRLMYPRNYDPRKSYPLVISVSGSGGVGTNNTSSMHPTNLARYLFTIYYHDKPYECFSLVPQIPPSRGIPAPYWPRGAKGAPNRLYHPDWPTVNEQGWYAQATLALIRRLIEDKRVNIDADRVYFTGYSYGGKACWEFLRAGREVFAAALCVSGWPIGRAFSDPNSAMLKRLDMEVRRHAHIPVYIFSGQRDPMRLGSRAVYKVLRARGAKCNYIEFPAAGHGNVPGAAYRNRKHITWLFEQDRRKNPPAGKDPYPAGAYPAAG